ncbi:hypothetical protein FALBO_8232 [Fusarium albosuccineum]|uniref:Uncharacterized protein n=1 Tax=Fusarium albosuccineum TaxID=1237068 RepID=A0A8H4L9W1_9HYPO|nr:hypothetical protein FALBO_8232 [Fusarium albosuccineum]
MPAASSKRVDSDVLLAIKPEHLANIISREKNHEYRKYRLKDGVVRLWLYETAGGGGRASITHIARIPASIRHEPGSVPIEPPGIGNIDILGHCRVEGALPTSLPYPGRGVVSSTLPG